MVRLAVKFSPSKKAENSLQLLVSLLPKSYSGLCKKECNEERLETRLI